MLIGSPDAGTSGNWDECCVHCCSLLRSVSQSGKLEVCPGAPRAASIERRAVAVSTGALAEMERRTDWLVRLRLDRVEEGGWGTTAGAVQCTGGGKDLKCSGASEQ